MTARRVGVGPLRRAAGVLVALALLAAAGCTTEPPEPPPTGPQPSASPTESKRDRAARERAEAATASLLAVNEEEDRLWAEGGAEKATPTLKKYATGEALKSITDGLAMAKKEGLRTTSGPTTLLTEPQGIGNPERVDLVQCVDRSTAKVVDKDGKPFDDGFEETRLMHSYQVQLVDDQWKVATIDSTLLEEWDQAPCDGRWEDS